MIFAVKSSVGYGRKASSKSTLMKHLGLKTGRKGMMPLTEMGEGTAGSVGSMGVQNRW